MNTELKNRFVESIKMGVGRAKKEKELAIKLNNDLTCFYNALISFISEHEREDYELIIKDPYAYIQLKGMSVFHVETRIDEGEVVIYPIASLLGRKFCDIEDLKEVLNKLLGDPIFINSFFTIKPESCNNVENNEYTKIIKNTLLKFDEAQQFASLFNQELEKIAMALSDKLEYTHYRRSVYYNKSFLSELTLLGEKFFDTQKIYDLACVSDDMEKLIKNELLSALSKSEDLLTEILDSDDFSMTDENNQNEYFECIKNIYIKQKSKEVENFKDVFNLLKKELTDIFGDYFKLSVEKNGITLFVKNIKLLQLYYNVENCNYEYFLEMSNLCNEVVVFDIEDQSNLQERLCDILSRCQFSEIVNKTIFINDQYN